MHRRVSPSRERKGCGDGQCGANRGQGAQGERAVARDEPERQRAAGHGDGPEEDRVEDHEEREQGARRLARAQTGAPESPDRQRRAAHAAGRQQARGRRAAEGHLRARGKTQPRCDAATDEPEQRDVAGEGQQLEQRGTADPERISVQCPAESVREGLQRAARDDDHHRGRRHDGGQERRPARQRAAIEGEDGIGSETGRVVEPGECGGHRSEATEPSRLRHQA